MYIMYIGISVPSLHILQITEGRLRTHTSLLGADERALRHGGPPAGSEGHHVTAPALRWVKQWDFTMKNGDLMGSNGI